MTRARDGSATRRASLIVLAGGRSTRMGRPKHELAVGDVSLLTWLVARLGPSFSETLVVGAPAPPGARSVPDRRLGAGPLAGIESGLLAAANEDAFVLACDTPRATADLAALLIERAAGHDAAVPRLAGRPQPTAAAYARGAAAKIGAYLDRGERRATEALGVLDVAFVDEAALLSEGHAAGELVDLDTPDDYRAFLRDVGK